jgi:hypothetical protein
MIVNQMNSLELVCQLAFASLLDPCVLLSTLEVMITVSL